MGGQRRYPPELRERAVRMYREAEPKPVVRQMARQLGVHPEALRTWIRTDDLVVCGLCFGQLTALGFLVRVADGGREVLVAQVGQRRHLMFVFE